MGAGASTKSSVSSIEPSCLTSPGERGQGVRAWAEKLLQERKEKEFGDQLRGC